MKSNRLQQLKGLYGLTLTFIALTFLSSSCLMQFAIQRNGGNSRVVNLSVRQRMLNQRWTKCVLALERTPDGEEQTKTASRGFRVACLVDDGSLGATTRRQAIGAAGRFTKNNGITEGFHRKMKLIQRRAYGFRNFDNYRLRVIAQCG